MPPPRPCARRRCLRPGSPALPETRSACLLATPTLAYGHPPPRCRLPPLGPRAAVPRLGGSYPPPHRSTPLACHAARRPPGWPAPCGYNCVTAWWPRACGTGAEQASARSGGGQAGDCVVGTGQLLARLSGEAAPNPTGFCSLPALLSLAASCLVNPGSVTGGAARSTCRVVRSHPPVSDLPGATTASRNATAASGRPDTFAALLLPVPAPGNKAGIASEAERQLLLAHLRARTPTRSRVTGGESPPRVAPEEVIRRLHAQVLRRPGGRLVLTAWRFLFYQFNATACCSGVANATSVFSNFSSFVVECHVLYCHLTLL
ncbi:hypothetical protein BS78_09G254400 [Paspalum vaginatum]|nr:hypothetical protein BS78_09G254400 [Paspalum vaginatum]